MVGSIRAARHERNDWNHDTDVDADVGSLSLPARRWNHTQKHYSLPFSLNPSPSYHLPTLLCISSLSVQSSHRLTAIPSFPSIQYRVHSSSRPRICDGSKSPGRQHHIFRNFLNIYLKHCSKHIWINVHRVFGKVLNTYWKCSSCN